MARKNKTKKPITIDTKAGSLAYNRLDLQVSQTLHMAIELYTNPNYLFILDHYDDISVFDNDVKPDIVSYYQVKSSEDSISIDTIISEEWVAKLHEHLSSPEWVVHELGLITNCPIKMVISTIDSDGDTHREEKRYSAEKTPFSAFHSTILEKVKADIAKRKGISPSDVDLTKFVHMRTTLSIHKHREIVEQEMSSFLQQQYPRITVDSAKTIYHAMMDLLTRRQEYELLDKDASFSIVREKKGFSKDDFSRVIDESMYVAVPAFDEIQKILQYKDDEKRNQAAYEYACMLADFQRKSDSFTSTFLRTRQLCLDNPCNSNEPALDYCNRIYGMFSAPNPIYNEIYISILVACVLINEWRRSR